LTNTKKLPESPSLIGPFKIHVREDIGRRANQPETDILRANVARWKQIRFDQDNFVGLTVSRLVNSLINAALLDNLSRLKRLGRSSAKRPTAPPGPAAITR
jgi:hypothetical protein